jgi:nicotinate phosphoribosyltransferase
MSEALRRSALLTDLYELTMAAAYFENGFRADASFELFVRSLPPQRGYLLAAGLEQALDFLENVRFQPKDIRFLRRHSAFAHGSDAFFDYLKTFRFTGEVWAVPEGTPSSVRNLCCASPDPSSKHRLSRPSCCPHLPSRP